MARKSSDLFTLLQSRGGGRGASGRQGILGQLTGWLSGLFSSSKRRYHDGGGRRPMQFSSMALLGIVFASLGVGYLLGDAFPLAGRAALRRGQQDPGPVRPGVIGTGNPGLDPFRLTPEKEVEAMSTQAFALAMYGEDGRSQASDLALQLRAQGVETARPYLLWSRHCWLTVAYYDGASGAEDVVKKLRAVGDLAGHPEFGAERKRIKDWPPAIEIR